MSRLALAIALTAALVTENSFGQSPERRANGSETDNLHAPDSPLCLTLFRGLGEQPVLPAAPTEQPDANGYVNCITTYAPYGGDTPPDSGLKTQVGLIYLRPMWTTQNFNMPIAVNNGVTYLGSARDNVQNFNVAPLFTIDYFPAGALPPLPSDWKAGLGISGLTANLSSTLDRADTIGTAVSKFHGTNSLALTNVNALEYIAKTPDLDDKHSTQRIFRGGFRYTHITQNLDMTQSTGNSHLSSQEDYNGFGLTFAAEWRCILLTTGIDPSHPPPPPQIPDFNWLNFFVKLRGSGLIGTNSRSSSFNTTIMALGIPPNANISQSSTSFVPCGEVDVGLEFTPGIHLLPHSYGAPDKSRFRFVAAATGQVYGDLGMPSALSPSHRPSNGALYLAGAFLASKFEW
jgi:hypothetical protein